jgi:hypothetical protein
VLLPLWVISLSRVNANFPPILKGFLFSPQKVKALFLSFLFIFLCFLPLGAQDSADRHQLAYQQIKDLHEGVLLIRLPTRKRSIEALEEMGRNAEADRLRADIQEENAQTVEAFARSYDFSPYYFFHSSSSVAVRDERWEEVVLFDAQFDTVHNFSAPSNYFIAEFGRLQPDTATFTGQERYTQTAEGTGTKTSQYGSSNLGIPALVILSANFIQLDDPFPYYVRTFDSVPFRRKKWKAVKIWNERLHQFLR